MWITQQTEEVTKALQSNTIFGLTNEEAIFRKNKYGENKLLSKKKKNILQLFLSQLKDVMIYILIVAALISAGLKEYSDAIIILVVIFLNAIIGVIQESKAEKALEALKALSTPKALVKRDGIVKEIPSEEVVIGDIVIIDAGRYIPADLRLITSVNLKIDESAFTGESLPSEKDANRIFSDNSIPVGDKINMAFMSTLATYGRGEGIVVATGMETEIGKIAKMLDVEDENITPLQHNLAQLGKILGVVAVVICFVMFSISMIQGRDFLDMFMTSISLAVAAIPEGLPATVAIVLALGVQKMIKENAIIRKLPAVETLGSVNIICSDKTGTLTLNEMTVKKYYTDSSLGSIEELSPTSLTSKLLLEGMVLCNDSTCENNVRTGDPTEIALVDAGNRFNFTKSKLNVIHPRVKEIPFDSDRKLMSTINKYDNSYKVFTKGAIDNIINISNKIMLNGNIVDFTDELKDCVMKNSDKMSDSALRVLALGYKDVDNATMKNEEIESDLIFVGFMAMIDPPRTEVKAAISTCKKAGIKTIMITGDHKNTAFAIGKELGIASNINESLTGKEIDSLNSTELSTVIDRYSIFARVSPENKVQIVKALKAHNNIVSMTGDGVNDAPSLKVADIGVAMGITGTDVAKGAADMVLTDDNFSTIVKAVEEGRNIYNNIKKSIIFLLSSNLGEVIALFVAILLNWATPLLPIHILWVNLITDSLPALALGVDPGDEGIMNNAPRNPKESIFANGTGFYLITIGLVIGASTLFSFKLGESLYANLVHSQTMAFVVLSLSQLFLSLTMRSEDKSVFKIGVLKNKFLIAAIAIGILLQSLIITIEPLSNIFKVYMLNPIDWLIVISISFIPFIVFEIIKLFRKNK